MKSAKKTYKKLKKKLSNEEIVESYIFPPSKKQRKESLKVFKEFRNKLLIFLICALTIGTIGCSARLHVYTYSFPTRSIYSTFQNIHHS